jgi:ABC-type phosphate transport system substrate-binding protein
MRAVRLGVLLVGLLAPCALRVASSLAASGPAFRVVASPGNPSSAVDRRFLAEAFLKKTTRWADGSTIRPVDLNGESLVRQRFSEDVLGRSVVAVKNYWQQIVFSGRDLPPPELDTDDEVVRYVIKHDGAIGYVSGAANVERVKILTVR